MGFFKPAEDADEADDAPIAGDEGSPGAGSDTEAVGFADDEGGDALTDSFPDEGEPTES